MAHYANEMDRQLVQLMIVRHEELTDVAVIPIGTDEDCPVCGCSILEVGSNSTIEFLYTGQFLSFLNIQAVCKDIAQFLPVQTESSLRRRYLESCLAEAIVSGRLERLRIRTTYQVAAFRNKKLPSSFLSDESTTA